MKKRFDGNVPHSPNALVEGWHQRRLYSQRPWHILLLLLLFVLQSYETEFLSQNKKSSLGQKHPVLILLKSILHWGWDSYMNENIAPHIHLYGHIHHKFSSSKCEQKMMYPLVL